MNDLMAMPALSAADLAAVSTDDLKTQLANAIGVTAHTVARLAVIWAELERRGEDLSALRRGGLFSYLPYIAHGQLDPEVVVRCAGQAMLIRAMMDIPLTDQRRVLREGLPVAVDDGGAIEERHLPVEDVTARDVRRAFVGARLRSPAEQIRLLPGAGKRANPTLRGTIVKIRLTAEEYEELRRLAKSTGQNTPTLARDILLRGIRS